MNIILLSGGSGKRLWPLSNGVRAKQFLRVLRGENGAESMIERMYRKICASFPDASVTIAAPKNQLPQIKAQLGDAVQISAEPMQRDTFPAVALACALLLENGVSEDEPVLVCPVDALVDERYYECLGQIVRSTAEGKHRLTLMGIRPEHPSEKFGYILTDGERVTGFREKPKTAAAEEYIRAGALWNGGVFSFRLGYLREITERQTGAKNRRELLSRYASLSPVSFDIAVAEQESDIGVIRYDGMWEDLGTWDTLTAVMDDPISGMAVAAETEDTHIINELGMPMIVLGIDHAVVAATPDGILVADKAKSGSLKNYVIPQRPMTEKRFWGEYKVLDHAAYANGSAALTKYLIIESGKHISYQYHLHRTESWTVTEGEGTVILNGQTRKVRAGDVILIQPGMKHMIRADTPMHIIEVQMGDCLTEEDIIRIEETYD